MSFSSPVMGKAARTVIIGGGASGALITARLAERGFHVIRWKRLAFARNGRRQNRPLACSTRNGSTHTFMTSCILPLMTAPG